MAESQDSSRLRQTLLEAGFGRGELQGVMTALLPQGATTALLPQGATTALLPQGVTTASLPQDATALLPQGVMTAPLPLSSSTSRLGHPPDIAIWRRRLFELAEPLVLSAEEHIAYWPYISNTWTINSKGAMVPSKGTITNHYWCRLWSKKTRKSEGKGKRAKTIRVAVGCDMRLKDVLDVVSRQHTLSHHGECTTHNHTLDFLDAVKKPAALKEIAGVEMAHGYPAAVITNTLRALHRPDAEKAWLEAGGKFFSRQDVHNAGARWKAANPDARFVRAEASWQEQWQEAETWILGSPEGYKAARLTAIHHKEGHLTEGLL
jgi:hypothetical protein